jgi:hypothetical protein
MDVKIAKGYIPGSIGRIADLHSIYYHQLCGRDWGQNLIE